MIENKNIVFQKNTKKLFSGLSQKIDKELLKEFEMSVADDTLSSVLYMMIESQVFKTNRIEESLWFGEIYDFFLYNDEANDFIPTKKFKEDLKALIDKYGDLENCISDNSNYEPKRNMLMDFETLEQHIEATKEIYGEKGTGDCTSTVTNHTIEGEAGTIKLEQRRVKPNGDRIEINKTLYYTGFYNRNALTGDLYELLDHYEAEETGQIHDDTTSTTQAFEIMTQIDATNEIAEYLKSKGVNNEIIEEMKKHFLKENNK